MTPDASRADRPLALVAQVAAALPSLSPEELDRLADAVEALTDAIGLQRDWPASAPGDAPEGGPPTRGGSWSPQQLSDFSSTIEIEVSAPGREGGFGPWTPIWVVVAGSEVFVRTWHRRETGWYGGAVRSRTHPCRRQPRGRACRADGRDGCRDRRRGVPQ